MNVIARPSDADTATLRGASQYGLARRPWVSSVIAPRSYIMKVGRNRLVISDMLNARISRLNFLLKKKIREDARLIFGKTTLVCKSARTGTQTRGAPFDEHTVYFVFSGV